MKISELATKTGLSIDTIRFYEKKGLLNDQHVQRQANAYRVYTDAAVERLRLIQQAKRLGFTLAEIGSEIDAWQSNHLSQAHKIARLCDKMTLIDDHIQDLVHIKAYLQEKIEWLRSNDAG